MLIKPKLDAFYGLRNRVRMAVCITDAVILLKHVSNKNNKMPFLDLPLELFRKVFYKKH